METREFGILEIAFIARMIGEQYANMNSSVVKGGRNMNGQLRRLRETEALTRKELAELAGVDEATIYRLERRITSRARPSTIRKLAAALSVTPSTLLSDQASLGL